MHRCLLLWCCSEEGDGSLLPLLLLYASEEKDGNDVSLSSSVVLLQ